MNERREEEAKEIMRRMQESSQRVQGVLRDKARMFDHNKELWRQKLAGINRRREEATEESREEKFRQYNALMEKAEVIAERVEERLEAKRARSAQDADKFAQKVVQLVLNQEENQAAKEAAFRVSSDNLSRAREDCAKQNAERSK